MSGKLDSALTFLLQITGSETDLDAEGRNKTATQNKCSERSNKGIFHYARRLHFQVCVYAPGYIYICNAKRRVSTAIMNIHLHMHKNKHTCNLFCSNAIGREKESNSTFISCQIDFIKIKDFNYDICLLTNQINHFHRHHSHPIRISISKFKIRLKKYNTSPKSHPTITNIIEMK